MFSAFHEVLHNCAAEEGAGSLNTHGVSVHWVGGEKRRSLQKTLAALGAYKQTGRQVSSQLSVDLRSKQKSYCRTHSTLFHTSTSTLCPLH